MKIKGAFADLGLSPLPREGKQSRVLASNNDETALRLVVTPLQAAVVSRLNGISACRLYYLGCDFLA
jgi:hypothetical protein